MNKLLKTSIVEKLSRYERIFLAYSGGLDSSVLLNLLNSHPALREKLTAVHINHQLSTHANDWQEHCQTQCERLKVNYISEKVVIESRKNLEETARLKRYQVLKGLAKAGDVIVTAHHQRDEVESILLNLFRGSGIEGLAPIALERPFYQATLMRPLLEVEKTELERYAKEEEVHFINDESNLDNNFRRNFLRNKLLPAIKEKWPNVEKSIIKTRKNLQEATQLLESEEQNHLTHYKNSDNGLSIAIKELPIERRKRVLRLWLNKLGVKPLNSRQLAQAASELLTSRDDNKATLISSSYQIRQYKKHLYLLPKSMSKKKTIEKPFVLCKSMQTQIKLEAGSLTLTPSLNGKLSYPDGASFAIRYRQGGERIKINGLHKKLKALFAELSIPPWQRDKIPLLYINNELAAVCDRLVSFDFKPTRYNNRIEITYLS